MKKKSFVCLSLLALAGLLACQGQGGATSLPSSSTESSYPAGGNDGRVKNNLYRAYVEQEYGGGKRTLPSTRSPKMLVVPVVFKDTASSIPDEALASFLTDVEKAYFGKSSLTSYESVHSFYQKSSYGAVDIQGEVSDLFYTKESLSYYIDYAKSATGEGILPRATNSSDLILKDIYDAYFAGDGARYKASDYDSDGDGYIDAIAMVYFFPYKNYPVFPEYFDSHLQYGDSQGFLGSYVFWYRAELENALPLSSYSFSSYFYSVDPSYEEGVENYDKVDAHVYIHETGHLFGLDDYYGLKSQNSSYKDISPAGRNTMMDQNVGDLDPMSKYDLGWVDPVQYDATSLEKGESVTLTLRPFSSSGDVLLFTPKSNKTAFNEYILAEYYTPTGLSEKDSVNRYKGAETNVGGVNASGIKLYSVDQRMIQVKVDPGSGSGIDGDQFTFTSDFNFTGSTKTNYKQIAGNNDLTNPLSQGPLIRVLSSQGDARSDLFLQSKAEFGKDDLFVEGNSLRKSLPIYQYPSGQKLFFDLTVESLTSEKATLTLTYSR